MVFYFVLFGSISGGGAMQPFLLPPHRIGLGRDLHFKVTAANLDKHCGSFDSPKYIRNQVLGNLSQTHSRF